MDWLFVAAAGLLLCGLTAGLRRFVFGQQSLGYVLQIVARSTGGRLAEGLEPGAYRLGTKRGVALACRAAMGVIEFAAVPVIASIELSLVPSARAKPNEARVRWPKTAFDKEFIVLADDEDCARRLLPSKTRGWMATWGERMTIRASADRVVLTMPDSDMTYARVLRGVRIVESFALVGVDVLEAAARDLGAVCRLVPVPGAVRPNFEIVAKVRLLVAAREPGVAVSLEVPGQTEIYSGPLNGAPVSARLMGYSARVGGAALELAPDRASVVWSTRPNCENVVAAVRLLETFITPADGAYR